MRKKIALLVLMVTVVFCAAMFLVGCGEKQLSQPANFSYDGEKFTWNSVDKAVSYTLCIDDGEPVSTTATSYSYSAVNSNFTATIQAIHSKGEYNSAVVSVDFKRLGQVTNVKINPDGDLEWDTVAEATGYVVVINNNVVSTVAVTKYTGLGEGLQAIYVRAIKVGDNSYYSKASEVYQANLLSIPKNVAYNKSSDTITWSAVSGAMSYTVKINDAVFEGITDTTYNYVPDTDTFIISVRAITIDPNAFSSSYSEGIDYTFLPPITALTAEDGEIRWSNISTRYQVEVSYTQTSGNRVENIFPVESPVYTNLAAGIDYSIRVRALPANEREYSTWSEPIKVYFLTAPTITFAGVNNPTQVGFSITPASGESSKIASYRVMITRPDGVQEYLSETTTSSNSYRFNNGAGEYQVQVQALPLTNEGNYESTSKFSSAIKIVRLENISSATLSSTNDTDTITFGSVSNAQSYSYVIDQNIEQNIGANLSFPITIANSGEEKKVNVNIYAKGSNGNADAQGKYYLDSLTPYSCEVTKLATVSNLRMENSVLKWNAVSKAATYGVNKNGQITESPTTTASLTFTAGADIPLKVRALGNPSAWTIAGEYSSELKVTKLNTPTITSISDLGVLSWTVTGFANGATPTGAVVTIGNDVGAISPGISNIDLRTRIKTGDLQKVTIIAKGNGTTILDSDESNSVEAAKLNNITSLGLSQDTKSITWVSVDKANQYRYTIDDSLDLNSSTITGTSISTTSWNAGVYSVSVYAVGYSTTQDQKYYVQSETETASFTKLATPTISREGRAFKWVAVSGAVNYTVSFPGSNTTNTITGLEYVPSFTQTQIGQGTISLDFVANGNSQNRIISSNVVTINQTITRLSQPTITVSKDSESSTFTLSSTNPSNITNANLRYLFKANNIELPESTTNTTTYTPDGNGDFSFTVVVKGGFFVDDTYYVDSNSSQQKTVTILKPIEFDSSNYTYSSSNNTLTITWVNSNTTTGTLAWEPLDGLQGELGTLTSTTGVITGIERGERIRFRIKVTGNNSTTFDSEWLEVDFIV